MVDGTRRQIGAAETPDVLRTATAASVAGTLDVALGAARAPARRSARALRHHPRSPAHAAAAGRLAAAGEALGVSRTCSTEKPRDTRGFFVCYTSALLSLHSRHAIS